MSLKIITITLMDGKVIHISIQCCFFSFQTCTLKELTTNLQYRVRKIIWTAMPFSFEWGFEHLYLHYSCSYSCSDHSLHVWHGLNHFAMKKSYFVEIQMKYWSMVIFLKHNFISWCFCILSVYRIKKNVWVNSHSSVEVEILL